MGKSNVKWPKTPPCLTSEQLIAREKFMMLWHQELPRKYGLVERFNHGFVTSLPCKQGSKTLEIGAGLGEHSRHEDLSMQEYHCLEYREEFCVELRKLLGPERVYCGDIQIRQTWEDRSFDRIIAIHVLEHLINLPAALSEVSRVLRDDGFFDIVIPTEGGLAYSLGRKLSAERLFRKNFKMAYTPIIQNEHVSTCVEILDELSKLFFVEKRTYFPLKIPSSNLNLFIGMRLKKK